MTEPSDYVVRAVHLSEVLDGNGERMITLDTEGEPSPWDIIGMLEYWAAVYRDRVARQIRDIEESNDE